MKMTSMYSFPFESSVPLYERSFFETVCRILYYLDLGPFWKDEARCKYYEATGFLCGLLFSHSISNDDYILLRDYLEDCYIGGEINETC